MAIELRCLLDLEEEKYLNQNCHASVNVSKSYFNPWMSNNGDVHTIKSIPLVFW
jgi:hypothetical protein